jgi:GTP-binding protein Era
MNDIPDLPPEASDAPSRETPAPETPAFDPSLPTRCGFAAIIGAPNAGKSTLVNALVGTKVSIVTHKVQTTRFQVRGVMLSGQSQVILVDTPGIFQPRRRLDRAMVRAAWAGADDADAVVHLVDAQAWSLSIAHKPLSPAQSRGIFDDETILATLKATGRTVILALNKIDLFARSHLFAVAAHLHDKGAYSDVFMISGQRSDGVADLGRHLAGLMPDSPWLYPADQAADMPARLLAAEVVREKLMLRVHEELPYQLTVETEAWQERKDGSVRIECTIFVGRDTHRQIILGKDGGVIREVGSKARAELMTLFERVVHLFLHIKVDERWEESRHRYTAVGLDFEA